MGFGKLISAVRTARSEMKALGAEAITARTSMQSAVRGNSQVGKFLDAAKNNDASFTGQGGVSESFILMIIEQYQDAIKRKAVDEQIRLGQEFQRFGGGQFFGGAGLRDASRMIEDFRSGGGDNSIGSRLDRIEKKECGPTREQVRADVREENEKSEQRIAASVEKIVATSTDATEKVVQRSQNEINVLAARYQQQLEELLAGGGDPRAIADLRAVIKHLQEISRKQDTVTKAITGGGLVTSPTGHKNDAAKVMENLKLLQRTGGLK